LKAGEVLIDCRGYEKGSSRETTRTQAEGEFQNQGTFSVTNLQTANAIALA
jgi:hypothetical protein